jgi:hypothetical protein
MQIYTEAKVVVVTDPGTGERLTLRFPSGSAFSHFVRRSSGASASEITGLALQYAASGRACLTRESRPPQRLRWAHHPVSRN